MKLLLHCCCAPCAVNCVKSLRGEGAEPALFWYNPNIYPEAEYSARRDCLVKFADNEDLRIYKEEPRTEARSEEVGNDVSKRCVVCYKMRLERTAFFAAESGFDLFTTTLLISPYQDHEAIKRIGGELAEKYSVSFLYRDFRPLFREGQAIARERNFYMQKYCGCKLSLEERKNKKISRTELTENTEFKNLGFLNSSLRASVSSVRG